MDVHEIFAESVGVVMSYYGKYRAFVVDVNDPEKRGRVKVTCPKVYGNDKSPWCEPCLSFAQDNGGDFVLPKNGEFIWVEFEEGNPQHPVYTGGLWSSNNTPFKGDYVKALNTRQIEFAGCKIIMSQGEIVVTNGSAIIKLSGGDIYLN